MLIIGDVIDFKTGKICKYCAYCRFWKELDDFGPSLTGLGKYKKAGICLECTERQSHPPEIFKEEPDNETA